MTNVVAPKPSKPTVPPVVRPPQTGTVNGPVGHPNAVTGIYGPRPTGKGGKA